MEKINVIIMGAAGRDFHVFNSYFRDNEKYNVVAFTANQIPNIDNRRYPVELSGHLYPEGIPIYPEKDLVDLIMREDIDQAIFAYSDIGHEDIMHKASTVLSAGADFRIMGPNNTNLRSKKPVISICAVRTGVGKSQTTRKVCQILKDKGKKLAVIRHPMPYGDLKEQIYQRFENYEDLDRHKCTIEEREEYEPHIENGIIVYAGVDYETIMRHAEGESDIIVWDGGNNDFSFYHSNLNIVLIDPLRPGDEIKYHPGETNLKMADIAIVNKVDSASEHDIGIVEKNIEEYNPKALIIRAESPIRVDDSDQIRGKRVLVVEDGPTLTHGGMNYGAGLVAAKKYGASEIVDPRKYAVGSIGETYKKYPHISKVLPAMGYGDEQLKELEQTIGNADCDVIVSGTPIDLRRVIDVDKPIIRVKYSLEQVSGRDLEDIVLESLE